MDVSLRDANANLGEIRPHDRSRKIRGCQHSIVRGPADWEKNECAASGRAPRAGSHQRQRTMRLLRDKKVLVTGAASGIGRALALRLASEGAHLFLLDIDKAGLAETVMAARRLGVEAYGRTCDVGQPADVSASIGAVLDRWGTLDILVNNAGLAYYGPTTRMTPEQWERLLAVNLLAPIQFTRELLPTLLSRPEAHLLNVVSFYGFFPTARATAYHVTKYGLLGLSEALRVELGRHGLGVTALCPGFVRTGLYDRSLRGHPDRKLPTPPRWLSTTPEKVAAKAVRAIRRNRGMVVVTPLAHAAHYLKRFAPGVLDWLTQLGRRRVVPCKQESLDTREGSALRDGLAPALLHLVRSEADGTLTRQPLRKAA
jgi:NAD(P)-dependent dehydrogenase (short-subunit alcohol dehydrogenase family)